MLDGHHARDAAVVGAGVGLAHAGVDVADHRDVVAAFQARRNADGGRDGVARANGQAVGAGQVGQQDVVGIAGHVVGRQHDAVQPRPDGGGAALVDHRPADGGLAARSDGHGHHQAGDRQVGIQTHGGGKTAGRRVVGFGVERRAGFKQHARPGSAAVGGDADVKRACAQHAVGQVEAEAARARLARQQGRGGTAGKGHRGVDDHRAGRAVAVALADHHAVLERHRRGHATQVDILPAQRDGVAGLQAGLLQLHVARGQIGAHQQGLLHGVVGLQRAAGVKLGHLLQRIDHHAQPVAADGVDTRGPAETGAALHHAARGHLLRGERLGDVGHDHAGGLVQQLQALAPGAGGGGRPAVAGGPLHGHILATGPQAGRAHGQVLHLQVGVVGQGAGKVGGGAVVFFGAAVFKLGVVHVGFNRDQQITGAGRPVGQAQLNLARHRLPHQQRALAGARLHVRHHDLGQQLAGAGAAHDHTV